MLGGHNLPGIHLDFSSFVLPVDPLAKLVLDTEQHLMKHFVGEPNATYAELDHKCKDGSKVSLVL